MDISAEIAAIQAASQGSELRQPLIGALNKLNSGSLPAVTALDAGKILKVGANGWEVGEKSGYMPVPSASLNISTNDTYDVTNYAEAVVSVSGSSTTLVTKTITQNGIYDPADDSADGYSEVTVSVPSGQSVAFIGKCRTGVNSNAQMICINNRIIKNSGNYSYRCIYLDENIFTNSNDFEIGCAFKLADADTLFYLFGVLNNTNLGLFPALRVDTDLTLRCSYALSSLSSGVSETFDVMSNLSLDTWYFARIKYTVSTKTLVAEITSDFVNYTSVTRTLTGDIKTNYGSKFGFLGVSTRTNLSTTALADLHNMYVKSGNNIVFGAFTEQFPSST